MTIEKTMKKIESLPDGKGRILEYGICAVFPRLSFPRARDLCFDFDNYQLQFWEVKRWS